MYRKNVISKWEKIPIFFFHSFFVCFQPCEKNYFFVCFILDLKNISFHYIKLHTVIFQKNYQTLISKNINCIKWIFFLNNEQVPIPPTLPIPPHLTLIFLIEIYSFLNCHYSKSWQGVGTSGLAPHIFFFNFKGIM